MTITIDMLKYTLDEALEIFARATVPKEEETKFLAAYLVVEHYARLGYALSEKNDQHDENDAVGG